MRFKIKEYPSIPGAEKAPHLPCISYAKLDGSNLRFKWSPKKGWSLFGTRHRLFDKTDPDFGCAIDLFLNKYGDDVEKIIKKEKEFRGAQEVICFCEFFGPNSFAGQHDINHPALKMMNVTHNDPKDLVLFDVNIHKKGMLPPRDFVNIFSHLHIPKIVYEGVLNQSFIEDVRIGKYPVVEGVICKGLNGKAPHGLWSVKIKTNSYLEELKRRFAKDWQIYV